MEFVLNVFLVIVSEKISFDLNEFIDINYIENNWEEVVIIVNLNVEESKSIFVREGILLYYVMSLLSSVEVVNLSYYSIDSDKFVLIMSDYSDMDELLGNVVVDFDLGVIDVFFYVVVLWYLKVVNIVV